MSQDITQTNTDCTGECAAAMGDAGASDATCCGTADMVTPSIPGMPGM